MKFVRFKPQEDITAIEVAHCIQILIFGVVEVITREHYEEWAMENIFPGHTAQVMITAMEESGVERHFEILDKYPPMFIEKRRG